MLANVLQGLIDMDACDLSHGNVIPDNILITDNGNYKISDTALLINQSNYQRCLLNDCIQKCYLSPRLYQSFLKQEVNPNINYEKNDIFSLGLCGLQMAIPFEVIDLYKDNNGKRSFQFSYLEELLQKIEGLHSFELQNVLQMMLDPCEDERIDFVQLKQYMMCLSDRSQLDVQSLIVKGSFQTLPNICSSSKKMNFSNIQSFRNPSFLDHDSSQMIYQYGKKNKKYTQHNNAQFEECDINIDFETFRQGTESTPSNITFQDDTYHKSSTTNSSRDPLKQQKTKKQEKTPNISKSKQLTSTLRSVTKQSDSLLSSGAKFKNQTSFFNLQQNIKKQYKQQQKQSMESQASTITLNSQKELQNSVLNDKSICSSQQKLQQTVQSKKNNLNKSNITQQSSRAYKSFRNLKQVLPDKNSDIDTSKINQKSSMTHKDNSMWKK